MQRPPTERRCIGNLSGKTLTSGNVDFDVGHIEPTAVDWRVVKFEPVEYPLAEARRIRLIHCTGTMGVEVVYDNANYVDLGILINEHPHRFRPILLCATLSDSHLPPSCEWFRVNEEIPCTVPFVGVVVACVPARPTGQGRFPIISEVNRTFVKTDDRPSRIVWFVIETKDILHPDDEISVILGRNHPLVRFPRLQIVF